MSQPRGNSLDTLVILRINMYSSRHKREVYNYCDNTLPSVANNTTTCIVNFKGQKSGQQDKRIVPGAYVVVHPVPSAALQLLGRVDDVQVVSERTSHQPAEYRLVVRRVQHDFDGFNPTPFSSSSEWSNRQRHLANMFVQWFDVDPSTVYLMSGYAKGIVSKTFANGFRHPLLENVLNEEEEEDDEPLVFQRRRRRSSTTT
jgi:hypothetical protein